MPMRQSDEFGQDDLEPFGINDASSEITWNLIEMLHAESLNFLNCMKQVDISPAFLESERD